VPLKGKGTSALATGDQWCHDGSVAYFTAVVAHAGASWRVRDVEIEKHETLDELAEALRGAAVDEGPVLAVLEHEDEWFALVRIDGEEEPRLFVSDLAAASRSIFGELVAPAADVEPEDDLDDDVAVVDDDDEEADEDGDEVAADDVEIAVWAGESDLLEDLGVTGRTLRAWVEGTPDDPGTVLAQVGETAGFADLLAALR
jgi:putative tRNA adenosine deaminase-associated protein